MIPTPPFRPDAPPEMVVDWLLEQGARLGDVLQLYVGKSPEYLGAVSRHVLKLWCKVHGDPRANADALCLCPLTLSARIGTKRQVLRLFPEIKFQLTGTDELIAAQPWLKPQYLTPEQALLPPEYGPSDLRSAYPAYRRGQEMQRALEGMRID